MPNMNFYVEEELHKKFKIACVEEGKDMQKKIIELMKKYAG